MTAIPIPSEAESRSNQAFDALLTALSRPGLIQRLHQAGEASIIEALLDRECRVFCADPLLMPMVLATGAIVADLPASDHVFAGALQDLDVVNGLDLGSDLYPDDGATLVVRAVLGQGPKLRLIGPGIETTAEVTVAGLPEGFWDLRRQLIRYPMGFDLFLVDGDRVLGVPRSTQLEVL